jgi:DNA-binding NtrC family response regulator
MTDTLLFVEDDAAIRDMASDFLGEAGLDVIEAENADAALAVLDRQAHNIKVLFTDVRMPGSIDGLALARMAPIRWPWINVIVTSGSGLAMDECVPLEATFIAKPWLPLDMLTTVMRAASTSTR